MLRSGSVVIVLLGLVAGDVLLAQAAPPNRSDDVCIVPEPVSVVREAGQFTLTPATRIATSQATHELGQLLSQILAPATGYTPRVSDAEADGHPADCIQLLIDSSVSKPDGYQLVVTPENITISAATPAGIFYGIQTLRQLLPPEIFSPTKIDDAQWTIPCGRIEDYPRFRWRGLMLDCSRHFESKEFVERFLDLMALHKMNVFHWHLTDDQGWRIEIKKYPKLTEIGGWRKQTLLGHAGEKPEQYDGVPHGGFYTQDNIREVVRYAADRFITIVPEIEMPGHSTAAVAAYPELGNTGKPIDVGQRWGVMKDVLNPQESTILFYQDVLSEVLDLFPSHFIHLGGDEVPVTQWENSPAAQARIKELNLQDAHEIQPYLLRRMNQFLVAKGRRLVGWDEILADGLSTDVVVMNWHGAKVAVAAAQAGNDVVMAPGASTYFDHYQSKNHQTEPLAIGGFLPLKAVYQFDPVPTGLTPDQAGHVLGAQGQIWTEYIPTAERVEYMAYPRACALAEVVWSPGERQDYADFQARLSTHFKRLDQLKINYCPPEPDE